MAGLGMNSCIKVKSDRKGRMIIESLEEEIIKAKQEGKTPFFVNATAGTTVMGGFDNLKEISKICKKYDLWLHCDVYLLQY